VDLCRDSELHMRDILAADYADYADGV
jgi:hypothetical protein